MKVVVALLMLVLAATPAMAAARLYYNTYPIDFDFKTTANNTMTLDIFFESGPRVNFTFTDLNNPPSDFVWRPNVTSTFREEDWCSDAEQWESMSTQYDSMLNVCTDARQGWGILANLTKTCTEDAFNYGLMKSDREWCYKQIPEYANCTAALGVCNTENAAKNEAINSCHQTQAIIQKQLTDEQAKNKPMVWYILGAFIAGFIISHYMKGGFKNKGPGDEADLGGTSWNEGVA